MERSLLDSDQQISVKWKLKFSLPNGVVREFAAGQVPTQVSSVWRDLKILFFLTDVCQSKFNF